MSDNHEDADSKAPSSVVQASRAPQDSPCLEVVAAPSARPWIYVVCEESNQVGLRYGAWIEVNPEEVLTCDRCTEVACSLTEDGGELVAVCLRHASPALCARYRLAPTDFCGAHALRARIEMEVLWPSPVPEAEAWSIRGGCNWHGVRVGCFEPLDDVVDKARWVLAHRAHAPGTPDVRDAPGDVQTCATRAALRTSSTASIRARSSP